MPNVKTPRDVLTRELREIYGVEKQLSRGLPKLAKSVSSESLRQMLQRRRDQGGQLMEALDEALEEMGVSRGRTENVAFEGLLEDLQQQAKEIEDEKILDAVLIGGIQKVEHYCIAAWGTARSVGHALLVQKVVQAMEQALDHGKRFDQDLTELAKSEIHPNMLYASNAEVSALNGDPETGYIRPKPRRAR